MLDEQYFRPTFLFSILPLLVLLNFIMFLLILLLLTAVLVFLHFYTSVLHYDLIASSDRLKPTQICELYFPSTSTLLYSHFLHRKIFECFKLLLLNLGILGYAPYSLFSKFLLWVQRVWISYTVISDHTHIHDSRKIPNRIKTIFAYMHMIRWIST